MDNHYLQNLIDEAYSRGGGLILNLNDKPAVVVLTVEKYNQIFSQISETNEGTAKETELVNDQSALVPPKPKEKILVTGGAGFIGSHVTKNFLELGYDVVVIDNLSAGKKENIVQGSIFLEGDLGDINFLRDVFATQKIDIVCHLAASVEVEESVKEPQKYLENNTFNTGRLLSVMSEFGVNKIIFSSTCAVYGPNNNAPLRESDAIAPESPYGYSKFLAEEIIKYYCENLGFRGVVFRYFNAAGCEHSGEIVPTHSSHLIPNILSVVAGEKASLKVNGVDYETQDGSCVRDFVHVLDIARAHQAVIQNFNNLDGFRVYNLGSETGQSVIAMVKTTAEILNHMIPMEIGERRAGDPAILVADSSKIKNELGFEVQYSDLETIISTAWTQYKKHKI